jgi:integrase
MKQTLRYVTQRVGRSGKVRWNWQRRGYLLTRLPDNLVERVALVERLNGNADSLAVLRPSPEPLRGTVAWVIVRYKASEEFKGLAAATVKYYERFLREIEALGGHLPFARAWTRRAVIDFIEKHQQAGAQRQCASVLKNLFGIARYHGLVEVDQTTNLRLPGGKARERIWTDDEIARWLAAAEREDAGLVTAFMLLLYTAQRPSDVLQMIWPAYSSTGIRVRQQKTKALLDVPAHPALAEYLDRLPRHQLGRAVELHQTIVASPRGHPVSYRRFNDRFGRICKLIGSDAQARDLRRTAMVKMALGGATEAQIASVSGHAIEATRRILETYLPRNRELAKVAIARFADYRK